MVKKAQFKIQQMAFLILAIFFFFILIGLFFVNYYFGTIKADFEELQKQKTITSLQTISNMPEVTCGDLCIDEDKIIALSDQDYSDFWPVASIKVKKIHPYNSENIECPAPNCNYYRVYDSNQENTNEYSLYVSLCKKIDYSYEKCEIAKLIMGVRE